MQRASAMSGISAPVLLGKQRTAKVSQWRQAIFYVLRHRGATFIEIADFFKRHHATVMYGCREVERFANDVNTRHILTMLAKACVKPPCSPDKGEDVETFDSTDDLYESWD